MASDSKYYSIILSAIILTLFALNVAMQSFNPVTWRNLPEGFYKIQDNHSGIAPLILNKLSRLILNILSVYFITQLFKESDKKILPALAGILGCVAIADLSLILSDSQHLIKFHPILHPLAFSPVIPLLFLLIEYRQHSGFKR